MSLGTSLTTSMRSVVNNNPGPFVCKCIPSTNVVLHVDSVNATLLVSIALGKWDFSVGLSLNLAGTVDGSRAVDYLSVDVMLIKHTRLRVR
jgi:hypothetical protein